MTDRIELALELPVRGYRSARYRLRTRVGHAGSSPSVVRRESNEWLRVHLEPIAGDVLSIGSLDDGDDEGLRYRDYFVNATSYVTSEVSPGAGVDLVADARNMPQIIDGAYDCVFCNGVLEHIDNFRGALREITRILKPGGWLILGVPFRQAIHMEIDYWRFTEGAVCYLLTDSYDIVELCGLDSSVPDFPAAYLVKAQRR